MARSSLEILDSLFSVLYYFVFGHQKLTNNNILCYCYIILPGTVRARASYLYILLGGWPSERIMRDAFLMHGWPTCNTFAYVYVANELASL